MSTKYRKWNVVSLALPVSILAGGLALLMQLRPININTMSDVALSQSAILKRMISELEQHPFTRRVAVQDNGHYFTGGNTGLRIQISVYDCRAHTLWLSSDGPTYHRRIYHAVTIDALRAASEAQPVNKYDLKPISDILEQHGCKREITEISPE